MTRREHSVLEEARCATRFRQNPEMSYAVVFSEHGEEMLAEVHDESLGGLGLLVDDVSEFAIGREFQIVFESRVWSGIVRHVEPRGDGRTLVGFQTSR